MASTLSSERPATTATDMLKPTLTRSKARAGAVWLLGAALVAALLAGCSASWSSDQGKTISPKGSAYSYKVPHGWLVESGDSFKVEGRSFQTAVHGQTGLAVIAVSQQSINEKITSSNLNAIESEYKRAAAKWQYPPTDWRKSSLAGAPALRYHRSGTSAGETREIDAYVAFKVHRVFFVECIYTLDTRSDVLNACNNVTESFVVH
ncbi:MAG: hypothetical protein ABSB96_03860 [Gaiellaceae bacterium]